MRAACFALIAMLTAGCSGGAGPALSATGVSISAPMTGVSARAAYMTLTNNGDAPVTLTSIASPQFEIVELHETLVEDQVARMREVAELVIPARSSVRLERGGKHLMLMHPTSPVAGEPGTLGSTRAAEAIRLDFYANGSLLLTVSVPSDGN